MNKLLLRLAPVAALCMPVLALGQTGRANPADPKAAAPTLHYQSAFSDYRPWQDIKPGNWRALNDGLNAPATGQGGQAGHSGHAMPGMPSAASAPTPAASRPAMPGHAGHRMHGGKP